jgi:hypothetical protein
MLIKGVALFFLIGVVSLLIYVYMSPEKSEYTGNIPGEQISFLEEIFDKNSSMMPKIEGFDTFKSYYGELPIVGKLYTTTKSVRPYSSTIESDKDLTKNLNATIDIEDKDIDITDSVNDSTRNDKILDNSSSLSGMNGGMEASLRESMIKSELRRLRR